MPLTVLKANALTGAINDAFTAIGRIGETLMPRSKKNDEPFAYEFHVASQLVRDAEARKKLAHRNAVKAGIMFDHEAQPMPVGTSTLVYAGDVIEISVAVTTAASKVDLEAFCDALEKAGMKRAVLNRLMAAATHENRAPHRFSTSLVTL